jgi:hypothetical protein
MPGGDKKIKKSHEVGRKKNIASQKISLAVKINHSMKKNIHEAEKPSAEPASAKKTLGLKLKPAAKKNRPDKIKPLSEPVENMPMAVDQEADEEKLARLSYRNEILKVRLEKQKQIIMWGGISFFMILIVALWIYNIKQVFQATANSSVSNIDISKATGDISSKIQELKTNLEEIKKFTATASSTVSSSTAPAVGLTGSTSPAIEKPAGQLPVSESVSTSTASSSPAAAVSSSVNATGTVLIDKKELQNLQKRLDELEKKAGNKK